MRVVSKNTCVRGVYTHDWSMNCCVSKRITQQWKCCLVACCYCRRCIILLRRGKQKWNWSAFAANYCWLLPPLLTYYAINGRKWRKSFYRIYYVRSHAIGGKLCAVRIIKCKLSFAPLANDFIKKENESVISAHCSHIKACSKTKRLNILNVFDCTRMKLIILFYGCKIVCVHYRLLFFYIQANHDLLYSCCVLSVATLACTKK